MVHYWLERLFKKCVQCKRAKPSRNLQIMIELPHHLVQQSRPFVSVDFCGPFSIHFRRRGTSPMKAYAAVFVCFFTRALHLEFVKDLTTHSFLEALKRFIGRRGLCIQLNLILIVTVNKWIILAFWRIYPFRRVAITGRFENIPHNTLCRSFGDQHERETVIHFFFKFPALACFKNVKY